MSHIHIPHIPLRVFLTRSELPISNDRLKNYDCSCCDKKETDAGLDKLKDRFKAAYDYLGVIGAKTQRPGQHKLFRCQQRHSRVHGAPTALLDLLPGYGVG